MEAIRSGIVFMMVLIQLAVCGTIPGPPTDLQVLQIHKYNMSISWQRPTNVDISTQLSYTVFYNENDGECWKQHIEKETKATLQKLKPYRKYDIFVVASNSSNTASYGPSSVRISNRTSEAEPEGCPEITDIEKGALPDMGWTIKWNIPKADQNGKINYIMFYKDCNMGNESVIENSRIKEHDDYLEVKNFGQRHDYLFKLLAYTSAGFCKGYQKLTYYNDECPKSSSSIAPSPPTISTSITQSSANVVSSSSPSSVPAETSAWSPALSIPTTTVISPSSTTTVTSTVSLTGLITGQPVKTQPTREPTEPNKEPVKCTTEQNTEEPGETLARKKTDGWLLYVTIALAVIVVIMGITIFMLIWQLYKNHRFYNAKERREQYGMENQGQDNP